MSLNPSIWQWFIECQPVDRTSASSTSPLSIERCAGSLRYPNPLFFPVARTFFYSNPAARNPSPPPVIVSGIPDALIDRRYPDLTDFPVTRRPVVRMMMLMNMIEYHFSENCGTDTDGNPFPPISLDVSSPNRMGHDADRHNDGCH